jgi:hypothetical protein
VQVDWEDAKGSEDCEARGSREFATFALRALRGPSRLRGPDSTPDGEETQPLQAAAIASPGPSLSPPQRATPAGLSVPTASKLKDRVNDVADRRRDGKNWGNWTKGTVIARSEPERATWQSPTPAFPGQGIATPGCGRAPNDGAVRTIM